MDWNKINSLMPEVVKCVREEYIVNNTIIKDDIFKILEKHCVVVYYPISDETKNRGFHIKRFLEGKLTDFVYINTAKKTAEQVFAAAHELGHVWGVAGKVWKKLGTDKELTEEIEEKIVGRFAAELLMPEKEFRMTFWAHIKELSFDPSHIRIDELIRVMVMQMPELKIPKGSNIYTHHMQGSSMGDVHMILMASFMRLPVFLSEDSDIALLKDIAKRRLSLSSYQLHIYDTLDLLEQIAGNANTGISHKEFERIVKQAGERENWSKVNALWSTSHEKY